MHAGDLVKQTAELTRTRAGLEKFAQLDKAVLDKLGSQTAMTADEAAHMTHLRKVFGDVADDVFAQRLLSRTQKIGMDNILEMTADDAVKIVDRIGNSKLNGAPLYSADEVAMIESRVSVLQRQESIMKLQDTAAKRGRPLLTPGGAWSNFKTGFGGTLLTFGLMEGNKALKTQMYGDDFQSNALVNITDSLGIPLGVAAGLSKSEMTLAGTVAERPGMFRRLGTASLYAGGVMLGGHLVDHYMPGDEGSSWKVPVPFSDHRSFISSEAIGRTTMFDAVPTGVALSVPVKDVRYRLGVVAASWLVG